jgi:hypothetical protein
MIVLPGNDVVRHGEREELPLPFLLTGNWIYFLPPFFAPDFSTGFSAGLAAGFALAPSFFFIPVTSKSNGVGLRTAFESVMGRIIWQTNFFRI